MWNDRRRGEKGYENRPFNSDEGDSNAQRDRARIIHSASFRRLQTKTQILSIGEGDFYRTRLTHSLEVAQIGSGICESLRHRVDEKTRNYIPSLSQIEAIGLGHDIGHPPFGHGGEVALNYYMKDAGGFEGNGQTLRIVAKLGEYSPVNGLDLTRRTMLGLVKYPALHKDVCNYSDKTNQHTGTNIEDFRPPKCIHDEEQDIFDWLLEPLSDADKTRFKTIKPVGDAHAKTCYKSFDTTIMDLADDIAYGVHDLEDAFALNFISRERWQEVVVDNLPKQCEIYKNIDSYNEKLFSGSKRELKHAVSKIVDYFIQNITVSKNDNFAEPLLKYKAIMDEDVAKSLGLFKKIVFDDVIKSPEIQILEYKGQQLIMRIFEVLKDNPEKLLSRSTYSKYEKAENKLRVISDYISGMSDSYATKLYHKLFSPAIGSIFDKL